MKELPLLVVENLSILVGQKRLVDRVTFNIHRSEIFALVGESGSGKSLTSLAIMRLLDDALDFKEGSIKLSDVSLLGLTEREMTKVRGQKIAMIFQEPQSSLNPVQTIGEQIKEVLLLHRPHLRKASYSKRARMQLDGQVVHLLEEVGIPDPAQRMKWYPHQLSGGQKQRIMIAMALACEPDLLIADEPTTALDVTIQKQILELLKTICEKRRLGILLITHDMGVVAKMADSVAVMRDGKILEYASGPEFFNNPKHQYSKDLIHALPNQSVYKPEAEPSPLLSVDQLKVWFPIRKGIFQRTVGHTKAVNGVSFEIYQGETLALVGESGSGKSTVGRAILRLLDITDGSVVFNDKDVTNYSTGQFHSIRKDVQVIFQDPYSSMNPRFTVKEIIEEGMVSLNVEQDAEKRHDEIIRLLERVGLSEEHLNRYPHEFSGGQRQRIAIARAIAVKPKLIICDEPTSALDVSIRGQVLELLDELQQEMGLSYLFITHDLSIIPQIAHRIAVMKDGMLVEYNTAEKVMTTPQHVYTQQLLEAVPRLPEAIA